MNLLSHVVAAILTGVFLTAATKAAENPPNALLILTDDQGWGDFSINGNTIINTPQLDRFAKQGASFERFYVSPLCSPTRASLLTGRNHLRTGTSWVALGQETMRSEEVTIAEALKQNGYATACFGKWHNGEHYPEDPNGQGFDHFLGFLGGYISMYFNPELTLNQRPVKTEGYITDVLTDSAMAFMQKNRNNPFFCYIPYNAPHSPFQVPDKYFDKYKAKGQTDKEAAISGMCESIDDNVGRLLRFLDDNMLSENTLVIFMTDNGPASVRYNGGMKGRKTDMDEGGSRVPLWMRLPGKIKPGTSISQIAAHIDVFPTIIELCGLKMPATLPLDGKSLVPLLKNPSDPWPDRLLFTNIQKRSPGAVLNSRYRLVFGKDGASALYDILKDPSQKENIDATNPLIVSELTGNYDAWFRDVTRVKPGRPPISIGYKEAPQVILPATEAFFSGTINYKGGRGLAWDWLTGWKATQDSVWWELNAVQPGTYRVKLVYTCAREDVGSEIQISTGSQKVKTSITKAFDPPVYDLPHRVPLTSGVFEKPFTAVTFGSIDIPRGKQRIYLTALKIPGSQVGDIKSVILEKTD